MEKAKRIWTRVGDDLGFDKNQWADVFTELVKRYGEPHRAYHTMEHITWCVEMAMSRQVGNICNNHVAILLALFFHDVVYDPRAKDNEEKSIDFFESVAAIFIKNKSLVQEVKRLIRATKHDVVPFRIDACIVVDIDLGILGASRSAFKRYEENIRKEYSFVPEETFRRVRADILEGFLKRDRIFLTNTFYHQFEKNAQENIAWSIKELRKGLPS
jgi:predicted metal-dependent HD superfamily phosphohydrolase